MPLRTAWEKVTELQPSLEKIGTNPQFCYASLPSDMTILIMLECRIGEGDAEGMINICYPYLTIASILDRLSTLYWFSGIKNKPERLPETTLKEALDQVSIPIAVELGRTKLPLKEIMAIGEGTIIELDRLAGEALDIYAGKVLVGHGEAVVIDDNFGVRVTGVAGGQK